MGLDKGISVFISLTGKAARTHWIDSHRFILRDVT
jgi:hypothetical protein